VTRTERAFARRRHLLWIAAALLALTGAVILGWQRMDREAAAREQQLATEADLRGAAVSTLTGDVRVLRAQLQADGQTPAAPDPEQAVDDLPDRARVPVPIPGPSGPPGEKGETGEPGRAAPTITPVPGASGQPGRDGVDGETVVGPQGPAGPAGPAGPPGEPGAGGEQGPAGPAGQSCPEGYSWQAPAGDPDALVCRKDGAPPPDPDRPGLLSAALDPSRRQYP
jgi:hypothetical protein